MHTHYRTKAIFLKEKERGEADRLFVLYTEQFGRIEVLARAIRKIASKLRAQAQPFYFTEIEFIQGKHYKILTDVVLLERLANAPAIAEMIDKLIHQSEPDAKIWGLLLDVFHNLRFKIDTEGVALRHLPKGLVVSTRSFASLRMTAVLSNVKFKIIEQYFAWNLLAHLGYTPHLYHCLYCRQKLLPESLFFSASHGGVACQKCLLLISQEDIVNDFWPIRVNSLKALRFLLKEPISSVARLKTDEDTQQDLNKLLLAYLAKLA